MADNKPFDPVPVVLDHLAEALRDLCTALAETEVASWAITERTKAEDDQFGMLALLLL